MEEEITSGNFSFGKNILEYQQHSKAWFEAMIKDKLPETTLNNIYQIGDNSLLARPSSIGRPNMINIEERKKKASFLRAIHATLLLNIFGQHDYQIALEREKRAHHQSRFSVSQDFKREISINAVATLTDVRHFWRERLWTLLLFNSKNPEYFSQRKEKMKTSIISTIEDLSGEYDLAFAAAREASGMLSFEFFAGLIRFRQEEKTPKSIAEFLSQVEKHTQSYLKDDKERNELHTTCQMIYMAIFNQFAFIHLARISLQIALFLRDFIPNSLKIDTFTAHTYIRAGRGFIEEINQVLLANHASVAHPSDDKKKFIAQTSQAYLHLNSALEVFSDNHSQSTNIFFQYCSKFMKDKLLMKRSVDLIASYKTPPRPPQDREYHTKLLKEAEIYFEKVTGKKPHIYKEVPLLLKPQFSDFGDYGKLD